MLFLNTNKEENNASKSVLISYDESIMIANDVGNDYKSFEIADNEDMNCSGYKSIGKDHHLTQGYMIGLTCAVFSSFCYASNIVFGKMALTRNTMLTTYDINFMRACVSLFVNSYQAYKNKVNLTSCSKKALILLIICNILAVGRSYPTVWAYQFISASKCLLIINTSPILIVIIGGLLLSEKVTYVNYLIGITALLGCYILTLSKSAESVPNSDPVLGYTFALMACVCRAGTSSIQRVLCSIWDLMVFPFYYTMVLFGVTFIAWIFFDGLINVASYDITDTILLLLASMGTTFGMLTISVGLKHLPASTAAPITNLEVGFGFIADILIFHYKFYLTDLLGACIIFCSLAVHITLQCYKK
ncbi:unnamed protein product [Moneuplotes crassus]|uniref:EamA domain-containing protein n=1 Tax=Euplotes crassus TaxID=5936 RepID=A0AAD1XJA3_EUPCR|nr:unnamed protein product [Moneuplotes crassus]